MVAGNVEKGCLGLKNKEMGRARFEPATTRFLLGAKKIKQ